MNYKQINYLMDVVMPGLQNANAFKVVSAIARLTWGWKRGKVELSYPELLAATGIGSVNTLKKAIVDAEPYIEQYRKDSQGFVYCMVKIETLSETDSVETETLSETDREPYQKLTPSLSETDRVYTYTKEIERNKEIDPLTELVDYFLLESKCRPPHNGDYKEKWLEPIISIYHASDDDFEITKRRIKESISVLREKKYTIANPGSLQNTAVALEIDSRPGVIKVSTR